MKNNLIMVVEDKIDQAFLLSNILTLNNYEVIVAKNGFEALQLILAGTVPNILVTDIKMPVLDGFQLMNELKNRHFHIPTIVTSSCQDDTDFEAAFIRGVESYVVKPYTPEGILSRVAEICNKAA